MALVLMACAAAALAQSPAYRSAFEGYQPFAEEPLRPWRQANDEVGRIGGWRAYAQEAQGGKQAAGAPANAASAPSAPASGVPPSSAPASAPASSAPSTPPQPAADPHAGHH